MIKTEFFTQEEHKPRTKYEAVVYFMAHLDIEMVSTLLDDNKTYQDYPKYLFISKLIVAFEQFHNAGDNVLALHKGSCAGCSKGCSGFTFIGKTGAYMDILFLTEQDEIKDIYECSNFVNDEEIPNKSISVIIDAFDFTETLDGDILF